MFSEEEVKEAIFQMEHDKASLPNGFPLTLSFISSVLGRHKKANSMAIFCDFYKGDLPSLNLGTITLLTKCQEANWIQEHRPICHLNVSFMFFTKVATSRMNKGSHTDILDQHNITKIFLPGHFTLEGA